MLSPFQQQESAVPEKLYVNTHFHQWMEKGIDQPDFPPTQTVGHGPAQSVATCSIITRDNFNCYESPLKNSATESA